MRFVLILVATLSVSGCVATTPAPAPAPPSQPVSERAQRAAASFIEVVDRVEPVAERICVQQAPDLNCDFQVLVESDPRAGVNAFQTVGARGEPLIIFTIGLIAVAQNSDELAFTLGHEAGHHIARHLDQRRVQAASGARVFGELARQQGADARAISEAQQIGSLVASRRFTQAAELEADALGAAIALSAGFDPLRGAAFFERIPDPAGAFLSTHPPNRDRIATVRRTVAEIQRTGRLPGT